MFTHLHVHSHYSLLDGLPKIGDLVRAAKERGFSALGLTDHGVMYGAIEFYIACKKEGIKPIIGFEAYMAPRDMTSRVGRAEEKPFHLTLLAKNFAGYQNLMRLTSVAHLEGFYYKPRLDFQMLARRKEGLIVLSGCAGSELSHAIIAGNMGKAEEIARKFRGVFGEMYFLEIQRQPISDDADFLHRRQALNDGLVALSKKLSIPLVATADAHYLNTSDAEAQDILVCVETGRMVTDTNRLDMRSVDLSLASEETMRGLFPDLQEAVDASGRIAGMVDIEIPLRVWAFPKFDIPQGETADSYLRKLSYDGVSKEYGVPAEELPEKFPDATKRLEYELNIISKKGYSPYFLIVSDFALWAREHDIVTTTRGSAAGSLVAYSLGITAVNPLVYKLPFERFLNLERPLPPDIDSDFADNRRDEVIAYVTEKYGKDKVAQIVTFGTMLARAAVRDVGRVLGVPYSKCDKIAKLIPFGKQGFHMTIEEALKQSPELKMAYDQDPDTRRVMDLSRKVEGVARHASIHAAGVVISPVPLTEYTPLRMDSETGTITTQYDMHAVEDSGLVKMDFLGIRNLSILGNAVQIVEKTKGVKVDINHLPLDDAKTFQLLAEGRTIGLFQLGGAGMTRYLKELKPTKVEDIMAMVALFRPGPMESIPEFIRRKHDPSLITYLDSRLETILAASYGVLTYQDDVLLIAIHIAGYSWQEADKLRKAMGKKIPKEMMEQKEKFLSGCMKNGLAQSKALKLWKLIEPFAAYGFNKAHAASYGIVAYQTAFMKANYTVEYMAALLTAEAGNMETIAEAVAECKNLGIQVLPPDVNESLSGFTAIDDSHIRFGLGAIKNLGSDVVNKIISERKTGGRFRDLFDFVLKTYVKNFNKKSWEALVRSGALDAFGERNKLLKNTDAVLSAVRSYMKDKETAQDSLFGAGSEGPFRLVLQKAPPASVKETLAWEKELLGLYVTGHPLEEYKSTLAGLQEIAKTKQITGEQPVTVGGIVTRIKTIITKKGEPMCFAEITDMTGSIELVIFPRCFSDCRNFLQPDAVVKVWGKYEHGEGESKILADRIIPLPPPAVTQTQQTSRENQMLISIPQNADPVIFRRLKTILEKYPGNTRVALSVPSPHGPKKPIVTDYRVSETEQLKKELAQILAQ